MPIGTLKKKVEMFRGMQGHKGGERESTLYKRENIEDKGQVSVLVYLVVSVSIVEYIVFGIVKQL